MFSVLGKASAYEVDLSDEKQIMATAEAGGWRIDILINNAGIVTGKYFHEHTNTDVLKTMQVHVNAPMLVALLFLPEMIERNSGHIFNIASSAGLVSNPTECLCSQ